MPSLQNCWQSAECPRQVLGEKPDGRLAASLRDRNQPLLRLLPEERLVQVPSSLLPASYADCGNRPALPRSMASISAFQEKSNTPRLPTWYMNLLTCSCVPPIT